MPDKSWKRFEREVASWFGGYRNPLSGRNNRDDRGNKRLGDVIGVDNLLIECKLLKSIASIRRAKETAKLAKKHEKRFVHIEREKGNRQLICFVVDLETAKRIASLLAIDVKPYVAKLEKLHSERDVEGAHGDADDILCEVLERLGMEDLVRAWKGVPKWYA